MKKILSVLIAVVMVSSILTVAAFATPYPSPSNNYTVEVTVNNSSYGDASATLISVPQGETTTLTANPATGYQFVNWTLESGTIEGTFIATDASITVKPTSDVKFVATFEAIPVVQYSVDVSVDGAGGTAEADPTVVNDGDTTTVTAVAENGYEFDGWTVVSGTFDYFMGDASSSTIIIEPHSDVVLKAKFKQSTPHVIDHYDVTAEAETGGNVNVNPASVAVGETTTITATAEEGYKFNGWTAEGDFEWVDGDANKPVIVIKPLSNVKFTAHFVKDEQKEPEPTSPETGYNTTPIVIVMAIALTISASAAIYTGKKYISER